MVIIFLPAPSANIALEAGIKAFGYLLHQDRYLLITDERQETDMSKTIITFILAVIFIIPANSVAIERRADNRIQKRLKEIIQKASCLLLMWNIIMAGK